MDAILAIDGVTEKIISYANEVSVRAVCRKFSDLSGSVTAGPHLEPILFTIMGKLIRQSADPSVRLKILLNKPSCRQCARTQRDSYGRHIWWRAFASLNHPEWSRHRVPVVRALLDAGVSPDFSTAAGIGALHQIAFFAEGLPNVTLCVDMLLSAEANVNRRNCYGVTPLHYLMAFRSPHTRDIMAQLIRAGADVSGQSDSGFSPLHYAVHNRKPIEVVKDLLAAGADPEARGADDRTPADMDEDNDYPCLHK